MDGKKRDGVREGGWHRDLEKERQWRKRLEDHGESGLSVRAFCRREGLGEPRFYWWQRELAKRDGEARKSGIARRGERKSVSVASAAFAELCVRRAVATPAPSAASWAACEGAWGPAPIEVVLRNGRMLHVRRGFEADLLAAVARVLEGEAGPC